MVRRLRRQPSSRVGCCSRQGDSIQLQGIPGLVCRSAVFCRGSPGCTSKTTDECDSGCNFSCHFVKVLLEVQHPVQAHAKVLWSLLKHQAFVIDKHVQFPLSLYVIEMVGGRNCLAYTKLKTPFPKVVYQDGHVFVETLFHFLPRWASQ